MKARLEEHYPILYKGKNGYKVDLIDDEHGICITNEITVEHYQVACDSELLTPDTFFARFLSDPNWNLIISDFGMKPYQYANMPGICLFFDEEDNICYMTMFPHYKIKYVHTLQNLLRIAYPHVKTNQEVENASI